MGLFSFSKKDNKKQSKDLDEFLKQSLDIIFPKGEQDIVEGTKILLAILHNKVDEKTARSILLRSSELSYTHTLRGEALEKECLKQHLAGYCLSYFGERELDELHLYLLDLQNKIKVVQFFNQIPKEMKELFLSELKTNTQACSTDEIPNTIGKFGITPTNPVPVHFIPSNNIYLERLRTTDGQPIKWERDGSLSIPNIEKSVDDYKIFDNAGKFLTHIYISPYHKKTSKKAPQGFEIVGGYTDDSKEDIEVVLCNSTNEFYDKMFDTLLDTGNFFYPQISSNFDEVEFFVTPEETYANKGNRTENLVALMAFKWLRFVSKENPNLHNNILLHVDDKKVFSINDKKNFITNILQNKTLEDFLSDDKVTDAIFIRIRGYHNLIKRLTSCLLAFYSEHQNGIDDYLSCANRDYYPTKEVTDIDNFTIQDIDRIFIRDMLGGKSLVEKNTINEKLTENKITIEQIYDSFLSVINDTTKVIDEKLDNLTKIALRVWLSSAPLEYFKLLFLPNEDNQIQIPILEKAEHNAGAKCAYLTQGFMLFYLEQILKNSVEYQEQVKIFPSDIDNACNIIFVANSYTLQYLNYFRHTFDNKRIDPRDEPIIYVYRATELFIPDNQRKKVAIEKWDEDISGKIKFINEFAQFIIIQKENSLKKIITQSQPPQKSNPSLFIDNNGEALVIKHNCPSERVGKEMTKEELHIFAVELLSNLYEKAGMAMINVNRNYHREYPNIVMKSKNGMLYYVIIETTCYPQKAESLYSADFTEMKQYAKEFNATPVFAGMSFMNVIREQDKLICGDDYFVAFKGLEAI